MESEETGSATPDCLSRYVGERTILLKTQKRDGTWVGTPVSIAVHGDRAYVRTYAKSWKCKRLRNFPLVRFAPSTFRGSPMGPELVARARLLDGAEAGSASKLIARKYPVLHGLLVPLSHRLMGTKTLHYELSDVHEAQSGGWIGQRTD